MSIAEKIAPKSARKGRGVRVVWWLLVGLLGTLFSAAYSFARSVGWAAAMWESA